MLKVKYTLLASFGLLAFANAVKPPGYVEPLKTLEKNPAKYAYNYEIANDDKQSVSGHHQVRNGINTTGNFFVQTEDAAQDVSYFSDDWGFHPVVKYTTKSEKSEVTSHFALGKEAVDALHQNEDGKFPVPRAGPSSAQHDVTTPQYSYSTSSSSSQHSTPQYGGRSSTHQVVHVTPTLPPFVSIPAGPTYSTSRSEYGSSTPEHSIFVTSTLAPTRNSYGLTGNKRLNHDPLVHQPETLQEVIDPVVHVTATPRFSVTPRLIPKLAPFVTGSDIIAINAAAGPTTTPIVHETVKSRPNGGRKTFKIVVEDIPSTTSGREYLPPVTESSHNNGQFLKEVIISDSVHQSLEHDQSISDATSSHRTEAPSRHFLRKLKSKKDQSPQPTSTPVYSQHETLVITQRPISNKFLAPVQAGRVLANDDCNDEVEHAKHVKTVIEVQKSVNIKNYLIKDQPRKRTKCEDDACTKLIVVQQPVPVYVEKKVPVDRVVTKVVDRPYAVEKIVDRPIPYPVDRPVEKVVHIDRPYAVEKVVHKPVEKVIHVDRPVKVPIPVPYPVREIVQKEVKVPYAVEKIVEKPVHIKTIVEKKVEVPVPYPVQEIIEKPVPYEVERIVEKPVHIQKTVHVDRPVPYEKIVEKPIPYEVQRIVEKPVHIQKTVHVDRPYPVEKIVEKPVVVERIVEKPVHIQKTVHVDKPVPYPVPYEVEKVVHVDRPVEKIVEKIIQKPVPYEVEKVVHVDRPYPVEKIIEKPVHIQKTVHVPVEKPVPYPVHVDRPYPVEKVVHVDRPVEKIVHVDRPYPVEKVVHVDRPYPVQQIIEKPVHIQKPVPYPVEKIVEKIVEKPVHIQKTVHVDRPYPVKQIVEKPVPYPVPYEVQKVVHVDRPYPVEKIIEKPVHIQKTVHVPVAKPVPYPVHVDRPYPVEKVVHVDRPVEKIVHVDRPYPVEKVVHVDRPVEKIVEKVVHVDRPYPVEKVVHVDRPYPVQQIVEKPVPYEVQKVVHVDRPYPVEKIIEKPVHIQKTVHVPVEKIIQKPVPYPVHVDRPYPVEKVVHVDRPVEKIVHVDRPYPVEKVVHVDRPVEKIVHVDRPYPVEKVVHVDRPYPVEKIVEKIVEKPVHIQKTVHVDRPYPVQQIVEKPVPYEVEKVVHVDRPVEKIVHVDRPYPVEKVVHVDRPVEKVVHVPVEKIVHVPYEKKVFIPHHVHHEAPQIKQIYKAKVKSNSHHFSLKSLFGHGEREVKHIYLDAPSHSPTHYLYPVPHVFPHKIENFHHSEKPKFEGYHYEKPAVDLQHLFSEKPQPAYGPPPQFHQFTSEQQFSPAHAPPCVHLQSHGVFKDDYIGPTPLTSDIWATGTHDGITVKRHIENGRSLRIESGGFMPPLSPSLPIDEHGNPLNSNVKK